jgi:tetratricopeptide (TPR) repeat protein
MRAVYAGITVLGGLGGLVGCQSDDAMSEGSAIAMQGPTGDQLDRLAEAQSAHDDGDDDRALDIFQALLAENPTITPAYLGIGDIYMSRRQYENAEPAFSRAARLEPRNYDAQFGHGVALQMLERFVEALRAYTRALLVKPESDEANLNIATTYLQMSEPHRAVAYAEQAVELNPSNGAAHANLGAIYEQLGRYAEAIDQYIAAIELLGNQPRLMMNLINVQANEKRFREAAITAQTLVRIDPSAAAYERLGWCYFKMRQFNDSIAAYRTAVDIDEAHWPALNGIGVNALNTWLLSKKTDTAAMLEARSAFRRSLQMNSDQKKVIELLLN